MPDCGSACRIDAALRAPLDVNGLPLPCFYSVGIAVYPEDGLQPETLLQYADERMYEDKKRRQNGRLARVHYS